MRRRESGEERKKWRENVADFFELPRELILNLPRATLIGNMQLYVENYGGVIQYSDDLLRLKIKNGEMIIKGKNLTIKNFFSAEIFIEGEIQAVEYR